MNFLICNSQSIQQAPRRSVRPKTGLIDVDLVRGMPLIYPKRTNPMNGISSILNNW